MKDGKHVEKKKKKGTKSSYLTTRKKTVNDSEDKLSYRVTWVRKKNQICDTKKGQKYNSGFDGFPVEKGQR